MLIEKIEHCDAAIFQVKGRLDSSSTPELEKCIQDSLDQRSKILILDFSDLEYINSAGLRILVMSYQQLQPLGGQVMVCGVRDYIAEIFDISGYNRIFRMCANLDLAVRTFGTTSNGQ